MIKYNETYSINDGQGTIVFKDAGNSKVEATYEIKGNKVPGNVSGKLEGNILKSIYQVNEAKGLMDFTFSENGFEAKWKKGVEEGPMKGKWTGSIKSVGNTIETTIKPKKEETVIEKPKVVDQQLLAKEQELKQLEATLLQKQKELEAKAAELEAKAAIPAPTVVPPPKVVPPTKVYKTVTVKISNVTKMKPGYIDYTVARLIVNKLPRVGDTDYYTLKYEMLKKDYRLTKSVLLDLFSQGYTWTEERYELIKVYKDDSDFSTKDFHQIIYRINKDRVGFLFQNFGKPSFDGDYSFKISIVSIE